MPKKIVISSLTVFVLMIFLHMGLLLSVDPLSINSKPGSEPEFYIKEMRYQAAGIAKHAEFDSAIVGTSMAANFNAPEASELIDGTFYNLSLEGSLLAERQVLIRYLLEKKNIRTLIVSLDGATTFQRNKGIPVNSWDYLYNAHSIDDLKPYTNFKYFKYLNCHTTYKNDTFAWVFGTCPKHKIVSDPHQLTEWQSSLSHNARFGGLEKWVANKTNPQIVSSTEQIRQAVDMLSDESKIVDLLPDINLQDYEQFALHIMPLVESHPETRFVFYFPPYSALKYAIDRQTQNRQFNHYTDFVREIVGNLDRHKNMEIYWFADQEFVKDMANYKDITHYHGDFNSMFLRHFASGRSQLTPTNVEEKLSAFTKMASEYDIENVMNQLD